RTTPVPTRPREAMARKTLMITLAQSARNKKSVRQPSLRFAMTCREAGGKVRSEQALFVFGIKTDKSSGHSDGHHEQSRGIPRRDEPVIHAGQKTPCRLTRQKTQNMNKARRPDRESFGVSQIASW